MMGPHELPVLYTSRWQNEKLADLDVVLVGISRGTPRFKLPYRYRQLRLLAPSKETFALREDKEFDKAYVAGLEKIGVERIAEALRRLSYEQGGKPLILLCYEDVHAGEDCHRRMFADWWKQQTGQEVLEPVPSIIPSKRHSPIQEILFETREAEK
jgi:Protein of unknown function, DUF488